MNSQSHTQDALTRRDIARLFHKNSQIERNEIFVSNDPLPLNYREDARTMFPGFVGKHYLKGSICLVAINPGGGQDSYLRTRGDEIFFPVLQRFRTASDADAEFFFEDLCMHFEKILTCWNLWNIVSPILTSTGLTLNEIAFINAVPYRTRKDGLPSVSAKTLSWQKVTGPAIELLEPGHVIALGQKACDVLRRFYSGRYVCVPRTNGDRYISPQAREIITSLAQTQARATTSMITHTDLITRTGLGDRMTSVPGKTSNWIGDHDTVITVKVPDNPKSGMSRDRFALYRNGMTVG
jgi:hypothetical protein